MKTVRDFICVMIIFALLSGLCVCLAANDADLFDGDNAFLSAAAPQTASVNEAPCAAHGAYASVQSPFGLLAAA